ncbi:MAG TPA: hypothetical protein VE908_18500 [Mycobacterium sp.]|nr:hypothetical protein [Mycobacterium sp.]
MAYHGAVLVQLILEVGGHETRTPRPQRKKGRRGISGVQRHQSGDGVSYGVGER